MGLTMKFREVVINQGCAIVVQEGHCPAEFILKTSRCVEASKLYSRGRQCLSWSADVLQSLAPTLIKHT